MTTIRRRKLAPSVLSAFAWSLCVLLLSFTFGCTKRPTTVIDLTERLDSAETGVVLTPFLNFGEGPARHQVSHGFFWTSQTAKEGHKFWWSIGNASQIRFFLTEPGEVEMSFRCRPNPKTQPQAKQLNLSVNEKVVGTVELEDGWKEYSLTLSPDLLKNGRNTLSFDYDVSNNLEGIRPSQWPKMIAWDWIKFKPTAPPPTAISDSDEASLSLPPRSSVSYYLKLKPGSVLETGPISEKVTQGQAPEPTDLEVNLQSQESEQLHSYVLSPGRSHSLELPVEANSEIVKVTLKPKSREEDALLTTGITLRPQILEPQAEAQTPDATPKPKDKRPNIVLYLVDTLRADHVGCYGYEKPTTPRLDEFAKEATVFTRAQAQSSFTKPSVASIMSGLLPRTHGALSFEHIFADPEPLALRLQKLGYRTGGFNTNNWITKEFGFARGYDEYSTRNGEPSIYVNDRALHWLDSSPGDAPFFLYVHTLDPHDPYEPREKYRQRLAPNIDPKKGTEGLADLQHLMNTGEKFPPELAGELAALYDGEIAQNDDSFGQLLDALKARGLYEDTLIIFVSDHGEEFQDHGWWHHAASLYEEVLSVPLVVKFPNSVGQGERVNSLVTHIDILPTVLEAVGVEVPAELPGRSLLRTLLDPDIADKGRTVFSTVERFVPDNKDDHISMDSVIEEDYKLIHTTHHFRLGRNDPVELYNKRRDNLETKKVHDRPVILGYLLKLISEMKQAAPEGAPEVDQDLVRERLESLPYL